MFFAHLLPAEFSHKNRQLIVANSEGVNEADDFAIPSRQAGKSRSLWRCGGRPQWRKWHRQCG